jgi:predicted Zn-dependent protease
MSEARIALFRKMLEAEPHNTAVRFGLANELLKLEMWSDAAAELQLYLSQTDDQGAAWGRLAQALEHLHRNDEARSAYERGIAAAHRHGHPGLAADFEAALAEML